MSGLLTRTVVKGIQAELHKPSWRLDSRSLSLSLAHVQVQVVVRALLHPRSLLVIRAIQEGTKAAECLSLF